MTSTCCVNLFSRCCKTQQVEDGKEAREEERSEEEDRKVEDDRKKIDEDRKNIAEEKPRLEEEKNDFDAAVQNHIPADVERASETLQTQSAEISEESHKNGDVNVQLDHSKVKNLAVANVIQYITQTKESTEDRETRKSDLKETVDSISLFLAWS